MLMFGWDFEVGAWSRFWIYLIKICDMTSRNYFGKQNSTLGSVVPLAMFISSFKKSQPLCVCNGVFWEWHTKSVWWMVNEVDCPTSPNTSWLRTPGIPCGIQGKRWAFHLKEKFLKQKWDWFYAEWSSSRFSEKCLLGALMGIWLARSDLCCMFTSN